MTIDEAISAHALLDSMIDIKDRIERIDNEDEVLCFGIFTKGKLEIKIDHRINAKLRDILDKHHKMIIQELKNEVEQLNKAIEQL